MRRLLGLGLTACILTGCAPEPYSDIPVDADTPQYAPDDPCKGVVPQLCAY